jgi:hypothetical protein
MIKNVLITFGALVLSFVIAADAQAQSATSSLFQQITPTDCILTVVANGNGSQSVGDCENSEPQITEVEYTASGLRFIKGVCDSRNTRVLRVLFRGATYTSNTFNSPLSIAGDSWSLAVDQITPEVESGTYSVTVEADMVDGTTLSSTMTVTLAPVSYGEADPGFTPEVPSVPATSGWSILYGLASPHNLSSPLATMYEGSNNTRQSYYDTGSGATLPLPKLLIDTLLLLGAGFTIAIISVIVSLWRRRLS